VNVNRYSIAQLVDDVRQIVAVSWLPGRGASPHDHGTWSVVVGELDRPLAVRHGKADREAILRAGGMMTWYIGYSP
jgi:hypothetical protein